MRTQEIAYREDICKLLLPGSTAVELGVAEGHFSDKLLESKNIAHLFSIDMYAGDRGHDIAQYKNAFRRLDRHRGRVSLLKLRFDEALDLFPDESLDLVYVDGYAHTGEEGGSTFYQWYSKVKRGGIIAGHDYSMQFPLVVKAVDEFCQKKQLNMLLIPDMTPGWNHGQPTWYAFKPVL